MRRRISTLAVCLAVSLIWVLGVAGTAAALAPPGLDVTGASLIVAGSGQQLYGDAPNTERSIASTTKLMTALIVLERVHNLNQVFKQGPWEDENGDSQIGLEPGERMTVRNLLKAMLIPSADDAAEDLAYNVGGHSVKRFLRMMNAEARKLGLRHTHYTTPTGLDTPGNFSTPNDLLRLADYDMHYSAFFRQTVRQQYATIWNANHTARYELVNTNTLLGAVPWIDGIKTGHTYDAGYVLVAQGDRGGLKLIGAVLGTNSEYARNENALALLDWGYANFHEIHPLTAGMVLAHAKVAYESAPAALLAARGYRGVVPRSARVRLLVRAPKQLTGPLKANAVVGHVLVVIGGRRVARVALLVKHAIPAEATGAKIAHLLTRPITLIAILLLVSGGAVMLVQRRRYPSQRRRPKVYTTEGIEEG